MCKWLEKIRKNQEERMYKSGYDHTVGCIVRGEETPEALSVMADNPFERTAFDRGMQAALRDLPRYVDKQGALRQDI